jgi:hypothetical protein
VVVRRRAAVLFAGIGFLPGQPAGIPLLPAGPQLPAHYGDYAPTTQQVEPILWFPPNATLAGLWGGGLAALPQEQGSDGFISGTIYNALLDSDGEAVAETNPARSAPRVAAAPDGVAQNGCEQLPGQIQSGAQYWNGRATSRLPAVSPASVSGDPVEGSASDPSNLLTKARAGAWCRSRPVAFANSSPLASRAFWLPAAILLTGVSLFLLSRGVRLPSQ